MTDSPPSSFLRPAKVIMLLLLGLLVYLIVLIANLPAGWLWQQAAPRVDLPPGLAVEQVSGSVWDGAAAVVFQGRQIGANWQIHRPAMTEPTLPLSFDIASGGSSLQGELQLQWPGSARITADGRVRVQDFEKEIRQAGGAMLAGNIIIDRLDMAFTDRALINADGLARWPGGEVSWPMGDSRARADFPPMQARLNGNDQSLALEITRAGQSAPFAQADIMANGMMNLRVYKRLVDLAGQPWSGAAQPGDVIFRVRQRLMPGGG